MEKEVDILLVKMFLERYSEECCWYNVCQGVDILGVWLVSVSGSIFRNNAPFRVHTEHCDVWREYWN